MTAPRIVEEEAWRARAACAEVEDADTIFFPTPIRGVNSRYAYRDARRICGMCPVRDECLEHALSDPEPEYFGMWGGATPQERQEMRMGRMQRTTRLPLPASRLAQWRMANGYTKAYVGKLAGVTAQSVAHWEAGRVPMPSRMVELIEGDH